MPELATEADTSELRVAFFSDSLPERNGTGAYYHDLLSQLEPQIKALDIFQPLAMKRHPLLSWPMPGDPSQRLVTPNLPRIAKAYRRLKPQVVVSITPGPFGLLGLSHAKRSGATFISAFHTDFEELARIYWKPLSRFFVNGYLRKANKCLCKSSATVLINNSKLKKDVSALGAKTCEVMGTPIQSKFLSRPEQAFPKEVKRICFAGRLAAEKNVDRIIEAAAHFPEIEFAIGGEGPESKTLHEAAKAQSNVRFAGWLNRDDLIDLIDSSSLLLLPSKIETFGSVALEAMARGRPALVSSNAGIHDWPEIGTGLYTYETSRPLSDSLKEILSDLDTLQHKASLSRQAAEGFNRLAVDQWLEVLRKYSANGYKQ